MRVKNKIIVVSQPEITDSVGGAITVFKNLCNMLSAGGYEVTAVCSADNTLRPANLSDKVKSVNLKNAYKEASYSQAMNLLTEKEAPDLIIFFFPSYYCKADLDKKFNHIPRILMFHSRPDFYFAAEPKNLSKLKELFVNTVIFILFDSFKSLLPEFLQDKDIVTIPNAVETYQNAPISKRGAEHKKIVYLSRIDRLKGVEFLIKSFRKAADVHPDWQLDIYGQIQPEGYIEELTELVKSLKIEGQVYFKGVTDSPKETFLNYDFCVFPSYFEGFGIGLLEAMSSGLPAVGLRGCSGVNELITDGYAGFLTPKSPAEFASKIILLMENKDLRDKMGENASKIAQRFDKKKIEKLQLDVIQKIINGESVEKYRTRESKARPFFFPIKDIIKFCVIPEKLKWYQKIFSVKNRTLKGYKNKQLVIFGMRFYYCKEYANR